jgi:phage terminase large subunit GpA-like protein
MRWQLMHRREAVCAECGGISEIDQDAPDAVSCQHCYDSIEINDSTAREVVTDEIERVWYECEACGEEIQEHHKTAMLEQGRHIHHAPGPGVVLEDEDPDPHAIWALVRGEIRRFLPNWTRPLSWHVSGLYSPHGWFSWYKAAKQYLEAQRGGYDEETGESLMQVFENTVKGEAYEIVGEQPKVNIIKQRVEDYQLGQVPAGGLLLVAGVDVQADRLEVEVDAFGRGEECWTVDYQVIHGDPARKGQGSVWEALADLRSRAYQHAGGQTVRITAMAVDSGYLTQEVYDFCRAWSHRHVFATKGDGRTGKPVISRPSLVDINYKGVRIKNGVQLWHVGTDTAKERFYKRLELEEHGAGYHHFPRGLPDEYFEQMASEKLVRRKVRGTEKHEWVKTRERNEALDLKILCYAAAIYAGLQRTNWDMLESVINPMQQDMFARKPLSASPQQPPVPAPPPAPVSQQPQQPASSGFFNAQKTRRVRSAGIGSR